MRCVTGLAPIALLLAAGCGGDADSDAPKATCAGAYSLAVTRSVDHPGGGRELTLRLAYPDGVPRAEMDGSHCFSVNGVELPAAPRALDASFTLLLVDPGASEAENATAKALVSAVLNAQPPGERIAIYRWAEQVTQVTPFWTSRRLQEGRAGAGLVPAAGPLASPADALGTAGAVLGLVASPAVDALRTLVVVSPRPLPAMTPAALASATPHLVAWIGSDAAAASAERIPQGLRFSAGPDATDAAAALSGRLAEYRQSAHYGLGRCGDGEAGALDLLLAGAKAPLSIPMSPMAVEMRAGSCNEPDIAIGKRAFPKRIELVFTPEQKMAYDAVLPLKAEKPDFNLSVRMAPDQEPTPATAHLRGESSYACPRRNFSVNLEGKSPRFVFPGFAAHKFYLISMCLDRAYLRNFTTMTLMAKLGLFPVPFEMVELVIDGVSQGPYMMVENVADSLRVQQSRVTGVTRRYKTQTGPGTFIEVKWPKSAPDPVAASYAQILGGVQGLSGQQLRDALGARLDLDQYLTWLALLAALGSGDYVDEVYFYATETTGPDGATADYFSIMAWDQDDIFAMCHYNNRFAIKDPANLFICAEAEIDEVIFNDPVLKARYIETLAAVIDAHPPEVFTEALRGTADRIIAVMKEPAALAAMRELSTIKADALSSFEAARAVIDAEVQALVARFTMHRAEMMKRLAAAPKP